MLCGFHPFCGSYCAVNHHPGLYIHRPSRITRHGKGTRRLPLTPSHNKTDSLFPVVSISGLAHVVVVVVVVVVVDLCVLGPVLPPSRCCYWTDVRRQSLPHIPSSHNSKDTNAQAHVREQVILLLSAISPHCTSSQTRPAHRRTS